HAWHECLSVQQPCCGECRQSHRRLPAQVKIPAVRQFGGPSLPPYFFMMVAAKCITEQSQLPTERRDYPFGVSPPLTVRRQLRRISVTLWVEAGLMRAPRRSLALHVNLRTECANGPKFSRHAGARCFARRHTGKHHRSKPTERLSATRSHCTVRMNYSSQRGIGRDGLVRIALACTTISVMMNRPFLLFVLWGVTDERFSYKP